MPEAWLAVKALGLADWASGLVGWTRKGDKQTDRRTENLPILQDFVPYWGRCPKTGKFLSNISCLLFNMKVSPLELVINCHLSSYLFPYENFDGI